MSPPDASSRAARRLIALFAGLSLVAVATGCLVAQSHDVPASIWARNLVVWLVGLGAAVALARANPRQAAAVLVLLALAAIGAALASDGLSGVHRWVVLGPMRLNSAQLVLPGLVVALACLGPPYRWPWFAAVIAGVLLAAQPDASQAVALAGAVAVMVAVLRPVRIEAAAVTIGSAVAAAWAVNRPDPLAPVPEVEGIMGLAAAVSPALALVAAAALAGASLAPLVAGRSERAPVRAAAAGLATYFGLVALAPAAGAFPVPLVGMGVSPILGSWIGVGLLASAIARGATLAGRPETNARTDAPR
jgi:cell division protein FtsW (lipid II flippase)